MPDFKDKKPTRSTDYHVALLRERGLIITEEEEIEVKNSIRSIGYFRLSGYFGPLQSPKDTFKTGTTFKDILRLYEFDKKLRVMTSYAVKSIEIKLKAKITDVMSGESESDWYANPALFFSEKTKQEMVTEPFLDGENISYRTVKKDIKIYSSLINKINESINRNSEKAYIKKFREDYGTNAVIPSWMMMECISFGTLSRLYSTLRHTGDPKKISKHFGCNMPEYFSTWVHGFTVLRNHCAHHARLWNIRPVLDLKFPDKPKFITEGTANIRLFYGIGSCLLQALREADPDLYVKFKEDFYILLEEHQIDKTAMGFPEVLAAHDIWNRA